MYVYMFSNTLRNATYFKQSKFLLLETALPSMVQLSYTVMSACVETHVNMCAACEEFAK